MPPLARRIVLPRLADFQTRHPDIELRLDTSGSATLALGFGGSDDEALATARASLRAPFWLQALRYRGGWAAYLRSLDPVPVGRDLRILARPPGRGQF